MPTFRHIHRTAVFLGTILALSWTFSAPMARADDGVMHKLADGVYVFRMNNRNSPVIVTSEGVLIMDSQNDSVAKALKAEIAKLTDQPVKYVVYSHANTDHIRGADVFADTAQYIAQARQVPRLEYIKEASFPMPDILFDKELVLNMGGKTIKLLDFGLNHATGVTVMYLPAEKIITTIDIVYVHRLAFYFMPDFNPRAWRDSLREIAKLDFDRAIVGHGAVTASKPEVVEFTDYLDDLLTQTAAVWRRTHMKGPHVGIATAIREVNLDKYKSWGFYDKFRDLNIMAAYLSIDMGY